LLPDSATFFEKDLDALQAKFSAFGDQWSDEPSVMKAGQVRPGPLLTKLIVFCTTHILSSRWHSITP
jgi:hypothetical protein